MSKYGEIDACTIMRDPSGRSRGFAFLTYTSPVSVSKVLEEVHHLDGKQVGFLFPVFCHWHEPEAEQIFACLLTWRC